MINVLSLFSSLMRLLVFFFPPLKYDRNRKTWTINLLVINIFVCQLSYAFANETIWVVTLYSSEKSFWNFMHYKRNTRQIKDYEITGRFLIIVVSAHTILSSFQLELLSWSWKSSSLSLILWSLLKCWLSMRPFSRPWMLAFILLGLRLIHWFYGAFWLNLLNIQLFKWDSIVCRFVVWFTTSRYHWKFLFC